jgi:putative nucleotidyltransferase with HDIG domain
MIIKDEVYGTIEFDDFEKRIIDTTDFQRLRRIKQMSYTNLVYPGANHTRFEHSLGSAHLASIIADKLDLEPDMKKKVRLFALLHDIGHTAFSHEGEDILSRYMGNHEEIGARKIKNGEISEILSENYKPAQILALSKRPEGQIIESDIGADRMDYLKRDAKNTGVAYGVIDIDRIVHKLEMHKNDLVISEGGLEAAESLLVGRFMMFSTVYLHDTVRIATSMLYRAIQYSIEDGAAEAEDFTKIGDEEAMDLMKKSERAKSFVEGLTNRRLYKELVSVNPSTPKKKLQMIQKKLEDKLNSEILIDVPHPFSKPAEFKVNTKDGIKTITEISELVRSLIKSEKSRMRTLILVAEEEKENAQKILTKNLQQFLRPLLQ